MFPHLLLLHLPKVTKAPEGLSVLGPAPSRTSYWPKVTQSNMDEQRGGSPTPFQAGSAQEPSLGFSTPQPSSGHTQENVFHF